MQQISQDHEKGYQEKTQKYCPNCKLYFRSEEEIEHDCPFCSGEIYRKRKKKPILSQFV